LGAGRSEKQKPEKGVRGGRGERGAKGRKKTFPAAASPLKRGSKKEGVVLRGGFSREKSLIQKKLNRSLMERPEARFGAFRRTFWGGERGKKKKFSQKGDVNYKERGERAGGRPAALWEDSFKSPTKVCRQGPLPGGREREREKKVKKIDGRLDVPDEKKTGEVVFWER